jgi:peptidoglycan/LPS O-acetylase OafA/YrhL
MKDKVLSSNDVKLLHAVRGFAALYVVVAHAKFPLWVGGKEYIKEYPMKNWNLSDYFLFSIDMFTSNGKSMVIIFFVLSGFFIAYSFNKNKWSLRDFYLNRIIRIYTPFLFSMALAVGVFVFIRHYHPHFFSTNINSEFYKSITEANDLINIKSFLYGLFFLPNKQYIGYNFPYWSLLYEALFYLLAPFVVKRYKLYLIVSLVAVMVSPFIPMYNIFSKFIFLYSIYFAIGIYTYEFIFVENRKVNISQTVFKVLLSIVFLLFIVIGAGGFKQFSFWIAGGFAFFLIYYLISFQIKDTFLVKTLKKLGKLSYTLYLTHMPILLMVAAIVTSISGNYIFYSRVYWVGVVIAVAFSIPFYILIEERSLNIISKFKKKRMMKHHTKEYA